MRQIRDYFSKPDAPTIATPNTKLLDEPQHPPYDVQSPRSSGIHIESTFTPYEGVTNDALNTYDETAPKVAKFKELATAIDGFIKRHQVIIAVSAGAVAGTAYLLNMIFMLNNTDEVKRAKMTDIIASLNRTEINIASCEEPTMFEFFEACASGICHELGDKVSFTAESLKDVCKSATVVAEVTDPSILPVSLATTHSILGLVCLSAGNVLCQGMAVFNPTRLTKAYKATFELTALVMSGGTTLLPWLIDRYWNDTVEAGTVSACRIACQYAATFTSSGEKVDSVGDYPQVSSENNYPSNYSVESQTLVAALVAVSVYAGGYIVRQQLRDAPPVTSSEATSDEENPSPSIG